MSSIDPRIVRIGDTVRNIPDFPQPGIQFKDITPVLGRSDTLRDTIDLMAEVCAAAGVTRVVGIEARGFVFAAAIAYKLGIGMAVVRKKGKLPFDKKSTSYDLEYGSAEIEIHTDALASGERVALVDDLLATGGTMAASARLVREIGAVPVLCAFVIELDFLNGRQALGDIPVSSILHF